MNGLEHITKLAEKLSPAEQLQLMERLAHRLRHAKTSASKPADLYGAWRGAFPEDIDIISDIREIRGGWKKKFELD